MIIGHVRGQELKLDRTTIAADSIKYLEAEFHFDEGFWATSEGSRYSQFYRNATSKAFEPINTIKLTFGETVTQGRIQVWGIRA